MKNNDSNSDLDSSSLFKRKPQNQESSELTKAPLQSDEDEATASDKAALSIFREVYLTKDLQANLDQLEHFHKEAQEQVSKDLITLYQKLFKMGSYTTADVYKEAKLIARARYLGEDSKINEKKLINEFKELNATKEEIELAISLHRKFALEETMMHVEELVDKFGQIEESFHQA